MAKAKTAEVAEKKDENIQRYELIYLVANKFSEDEVGPIMADIAGVLKKNEAAIIKEENWGKRRLAYPIGQYRHAYYAFVEFNMPPAGAPILERNLRLDERIMRHLIVKTRVKTAKELEAEQRAAKSLHEEKTGEAKKEEVETETKKQATAKTKDASTQPEEKKSDAGKVGMEQLDEKLDKIVDDAGKLV